MKEVKDIVKAFYKAAEAGKKTALATIVHVKGSSYRRPGARMLVTEDGELSGAISGGCLEADVMRKAFLSITQQQNKLAIYNTTEEDVMMGVQLGCNGIVYILIEPVNDKDACNPIHLIEKVYKKRVNAILVSFFSFDQKDIQPGTCLMYQDIMEGKAPAGYIEKILAACGTVLTRELSSLHSFSDQGKSMKAFIEFVPPPVSLVIVGAGNDAQSLAIMSSMLGWQVTVADGRRSHATFNRFPLADRLLVGNPAEIFSRLDADKNTCFVLMTHNYNYDLSLLEKLPATASPYIGILGPQKKLERMLDDLAFKGVIFKDDQLLRIFGPVGLDVGAETPEEIAISIIAEIQAVLRKKTATSLKSRLHTIHERFPIFVDNE